MRAPSRLPHSPKAVDRRSRLRPGRLWFLGVLAASLAAAPTQFFTGVFTDVGERRRPRRRPRHPTPEPTAPTRRPRFRWSIDHFPTDWIVDRVSTDERFAPSDHGYQQWATDRGGVPRRLPAGRRHAPRGPVYTANIAAGTLSPGSQRER